MYTYLKQNGCGRDHCSGWIDNGRCVAGRLNRFRPDLTARGGLRARNRRKIRTVWSNDRRVGIVAGFDRHHAAVNSAAPVCQIDLDAANPIRPRSTKVGLSFSVRVQARRQRRRRWKRHFACIARAYLQRIISGPIVCTRHDIRRGFRDGLATWPRSIDPHYDVQWSSASTGPMPPYT